MKKYQIRLAVIAFILSINCFGQKLTYDTPIQADISIRKGVLHNGMTYYIKSTTVTKNVASYYIIQNVGSVLENENQRGLAHFLEHMAFNGTEHFKGKGILDTFEKHGLVFGKDINAYTGFDETVYNINNVPTNKNGLIDTSLQVLHDWSNYLLLTEEEIDAERGVIKEEWRSRQDGQMRIAQQLIATKFNHSKYGTRLPIGVIDVVENFEYKALRDFYHDWYRTDLQAIAIIGDVDVDEIEHKIKEKFSKIPAVASPKKRFLVDIPENDAMLYGLAIDDEIATSDISFSIRHSKSLQNNTIGSLKESLLTNMAIYMLSARIEELSKQPKAAFLGARVDYRNETRTTKEFDVSVFPKRKQQQKAFEQVMTEVYKAVKFGFTVPEIERAVLLFQNFYENEIRRQQDVSHEEIIQIIKDDYLDNKVTANINQEYQLVRLLLNELNTNEIHNALRKLYTDKNRVLLVTGVKREKNLTEEEALAIIKSIEKDDALVEYTEDFEERTLLSGLVLREGKITSEKTNDTLGATTFHLSNGIKVHYKFSEKDKNNVQLNGISYGGYSLLDDADIPSSNLMNNFIQFFGIGEHSATDLPKVLAGKTANINIGLSNIEETISGASVTKDVETMLQLVHLGFVKPRFDKDAYDVMMQQVVNYKTQRSTNVNEKIRDSTTVALYGKDHPRERLLSDSFINDISLDRIKKIYADRFGNAADFEFFIVGDIKKEVLIPLLEKYMVSIPTNDTKENWKDKAANWVENTIDKDIYLPMEDPKSSVDITYRNDFSFNLKNAFIAQLLGDVLQLRYTELLREQEGGTYGANAVSGLSRRPKQEASLSVTFDCNPNKVEKLVAIVHQEIKKIASGDIYQADVEKILTSYLKEREEQKDYSSYDMDLLITFFREGYNKNNAENFENIISAITKEDLQEFTHKLITNAKTAEITFKPID